MLLADHPVSISAESPASDRSDKSFLVGQSAYEVWNKVWQMGNHTRHATCNIVAKVTTFTAIQLSLIKDVRNGSRCFCHGICSRLKLVNNNAQQVHYCLLNMYQEGGGG